MKLKQFFSLKSTDLEYFLSCDTALLKSDIKTSPNTKNKNTIYRA